MRNAWHFYYALVLVIKVVCAAFVLRCSPLNRALGLGSPYQIARNIYWH
ncbi:DUF3265 domain-containing protein [Vibrio alginolyticus]|nr:DUF3265 domain-containing protein [Vibrio alginolyticus]ELS4798267.1 DUF3265 domain-containing protein [Vibrio alginolyticus]